MPQSSQQPSPPTLGIDNSPAANNLTFTCTPGARVNVNVTNDNRDDDVQLYEIAGVYSNGQTFVKTINAGNPGNGANINHGETETWSSSPTPTNAHAATCEVTSWKALVNNWGA
jgi:hypothetical protein